MFINVKPNPGIFLSENVTQNDRKQPHFRDLFPVTRELFVNLACVLITEVGEIKDEMPFGAGIEQRRLPAGSNYLLFQLAPNNYNHVHCFALYFSKEAEGEFQRIWWSLTETK